MEHDFRISRGVWGPRNIGVSGLIDLTILEPPVQPEEGSLTLIIILVAAVVVLFGLFVAIFCCIKKRKSKTETV